MMEESQSGRKLKALLELGQIIGLGLQIDEMLVKIARQATNLLNADRMSIFLYDNATDELVTTVALGMERREIRIPSNEGIAGYCFQTGEVLNTANPYSDRHFFRKVDQVTGYRTESLLGMPLYSRSGERMGAAEIINKKDGKAFTEEDEVFLRTYTNHAMVFIEMARLQKERIDALKKSREELERLSMAKGRALDHLSHELRTPLAIIQGTARLLKKRIERELPGSSLEASFQTLEKNLQRLLETQRKADKIVRTSAEIKGEFLLDEFIRLWSRVERIIAIPATVSGHFAALKEWMKDSFPPAPVRAIPVMLYPLIAEIIEEIRQKRPGRRDMIFRVEGRQDLFVGLEKEVVRELINGILKNAIENTPDEGTVTVGLGRTEKSVCLNVRDTGIGITEDNKTRIFDGLFHTQDTDLYGTKMPYEFGAGGKGLDLYLLKVYGQLFHFDILIESTRCIHIPTDKEQCPGRVSLCPYCEGPEDCAASGGTLFSVVFPLVPDSP